MYSVSQKSDPKGVSSLFSYHWEFWDLILIRVMYFSFMNSGVAKGGHRYMSPRRSWKLAFVSGFWGFRPQTPLGLCPWTLLGDFRSPYTQFVPRSKSLATPLFMNVEFADFVPVFIVSAGYFTSKFFVPRYQLMAATKTHCRRSGTAFSRTTGWLKK